MHGAPELAGPQPTRLSQVALTVAALVGLMTFASVLVLVLLGIPMLAAWLQIGR